DPGVLSGVLEGHGDAVWGLAFNPAGDRLASCSADGTLRIWDPRRQEGACLSTYDAQSGEMGVPSAWGGFTPPPPPLVTLSLSPLFSQSMVSPPPSPSRPPSPATRWPLSGGSQVNQVVSHPSQPLTITASDDRGIRFLDNRTALHLRHESVGSQPRVVCVCVSVCVPVSPSLPCCPLAGHDCSLRLWHLAHKTCVQELTAHRKKHEEAVHAVAFHPSRALSASAGADALAKVFV
ncbi:STRN4 protein, partial [Arenaria interpres]|nr:STRN4 protein [Arenaria interpres]